MATETERRFLLKDPDWRPDGKPTRILQGYFRLLEDATAHVSARPHDMFLLVVRPRDAKSFKLPIPAEDGLQILEHCPHYLAKKWNLRVRRCTRDAGKTDYVLTIKGPTTGISRPEFEYPLPDTAEAARLLTLTAATQIEKDRYNVKHRGQNWDVDFYCPPFAGYAKAELEGENAATVTDLPDWVGREVSHENGYSDYSVARTRIIPHLRPHA